MLAAQLSHNLRVRTQFPIPGTAPETSCHTLVLRLRLEVAVALVRIGFARKVSSARLYTESLGGGASGQQGSQVFPIPVIPASPRPEHPRSRETQLLFRALGVDSSICLPLCCTNVQLIPVHPLLDSQPAPGFTAPTPPKSFTLLPFGRNSADIFIAAL